MRKKEHFLQVHTTQYQNQMLQELPLVIIDDLMGILLLAIKNKSLDDSISNICYLRARVLCPILLSNI